MSRRLTVLGPADLAANRVEQTTPPRAKQDGDRIPDELFRQLVDSAPDAMVVVDVDGTISLVNLLTERPRAAATELIETLMPLLSAGP